MNTLPTSTLIKIALGKAGCDPQKIRLAIEILCDRNGIPFVRSLLNLK